MTSISALEVVGGQKVIGAPLDSARAIIAAVRRGFPVEAVEHVIASGRMTLAGFSLELGCSQEEIDSIRARISGGTF